MRRALHLLAQLERQELDRERRALRAVEADLEATGEALASLRQRQPEEHAAGWATPGGPGLLAGYLAHVRHEEARLGRARADLEAAASRAEAALRERIGAVKSLELALEQLKAAAASEAARRLQLEIEEGGRGGRAASC